MGRLSGFQKQVLVINATRNFLSVSEVMDTVSLMSTDSDGLGGAGPAHDVVGINGRPYFIS